MFDDLTESNFILFAMKVYNNPSCKNLSEFTEDLNHIKYLKRLFRRYHLNGDTDALRTRLVINHLIILHNVFGVEVHRMLFLKIEQELWYILKTFLLFLNFMPEVVKGINGKTIYEKDIPFNGKIAAELRTI